MPIPLLLALFALPASSPGAPTYLQWIQDPSSGRWYGLTGKMSWHAADAAAHDQGGQLVALGDVVEETWVRENVTSLPGDSCWIGLNDVAAEGSFVWSNGEPVGYTNWAVNQPNHPTGADGVILDRTDAWAWDDVTATATNFHAIVERDARPYAGWSFPVRYPLPEWVLSLAVGDLNGDGIDDVVAPNFDGQFVSILFGHADGTLEVPQFVPIPATGSSWAAAIGRFAGDASPDIAVGAGSFIHVLRGDGAGGFTLGASLQAGTSRSEGIDALDVDGDGDDDIAAARPDAAWGLVVHRSSGDLVFDTTQYAAGPSAGNVAHGDFDGDGDLDLIVTSNAYDSLYSALLNDGAGNFGPGGSEVFGTYGGRAAVGDFDRDGILDIALPALGGTRIAHGRGDGFFDLDGPTLTSGYHGWAEAADLDGDGFLDIAITGQQGNAVAVHLSRGPDQFPRVILLEYAGWATGVRALQLGGDSRLELVAADRNGELVATFKNLALDCDGNGTDDATDVLIDPARDLDGDGLIDACETAGTTFCAGDGTGLACPCGPSQAGAPGHGCANSSTNGGRLRASGVASVAVDSVVIAGDNLPAASIGLFFQGDATVASGNGAPFGDGLRCAGGSVIRLAIRPIVGGEARFGQGIPGDPSVSSAGSVPAAVVTRYYQLWYRDAAAFCTPSTFNLTNGVRVDWQP